MESPTAPLTRLIENSDLLREIVREHGTPLYLYSAGRVRENIRRTTEAMRKHLPRWKLLYAIKANPNPVFPRLMKQTHASLGIDCSSPGELLLAREAGFSPGQLFYTGNYESEDDLKYALSAGATLNFDDIGSYRRFRSLGKPEIASFRVNPGEGRGAFPGIKTAGKDVKFGVPRSQIIRAYQIAIEDNVKRFGLHVMAGSGILEDDYFPWNCWRILEIAREIENALDIRFEFINVGGGFGIPHTPQESPLNIHRIFHRIGEVIREFYDEATAPEIIYELGRYLVADAGIILARVTGTKKDERFFAGLDLGMNHLIRPALYGAYHRIIPVGNAGTRQPRITDITGQICENTDRLAEQREIPELRTGDLVAIMDTGAYGFCMASQYNGWPLPAEVMIDGKNRYLIREREKLSDLRRNVVIPGFLT